MAENLDRSVAFYRTLGFTIVDEGSRSVEFDTGQTRLKLESDFDPETLEVFGLTPPEENRGDGAVIVVSVDDVDRLVDDAVAAIREFGGELLAGP